MMSYNAQQNLNKKIYRNENFFMSDNGFQTIYLHSYMV